MAHKYLLTVLDNSQFHTHIYKHTYIFIYTYTITHTHTHTHKRIDAYIHTYIHKYIHTNTHKKLVPLESSISYTQTYTYVCSPDSSVSIVNWLRTV